jgi:hypothetical protein
MKVSTILDKIDDGALARPEFQRGYVWNRTQVRGLMHSLYRRYPVGELMTWLTSTDTAAAKGDGPLQPGYVQLLLDGQQRMTTLYGIVRGKPPAFFEGNADAFTGLRFHLAQEVFEFYAPVKMKEDPLWVDVSAAMAPGGDEAVMDSLANREVPMKAMELANRIARLRGILDVEFHVEEVTGEQMDIDIVVEIFNRVNSGGTKLSKGDLALARICAAWPDARGEMRSRLKGWSDSGFSFSLDWLLRNVNTIVTGRAEFSYLAEIETDQFRVGLGRAERAIDTALNLISGRLGLDHQRVLGGYAAFPLIAKYLDDRNCKLSGQAERDKLLYWYVNSFLRGRYAGSTETVLNADLAALKNSEGDPLDQLISVLRQSRGDLRVKPDDFRAWSQGARFYPLLYMLTRVYDVKDWGTGIPLKNELLGKLSGLELHHIFPKNLLYKAGYSKQDVNALANFTFLTKATNLEVTNRDPLEYIPFYETRHPGVVATHWIPTNPDLWRIENYLEFLEERRKLLATAANQFLDELAGGTAPDVEVGRPVAGARAHVSVADVDDDESRTIAECLDWVAEHGLARGEENVEIVADETGEQVAILDLAWPDGVQVGLTEPVALLLNEAPEVERACSERGFRVFTTPESFRAYVEHEILDLSAAIA